MHQSMHDSWPFPVATHHISTRVNASYTDWKRMNVTQDSRNLIVQFMTKICRDLGTCGVPSDDRHSWAITAHVAVCFHILGLVTWFDHTHNRWLSFKLRLLLVVHCFGALRCGGQSILPVSRAFWSRYWWVHNKHSCISLKDFESIVALILNYMAVFSMLFLQCNLNPRP